MFPKALNTSFREEASARDASSIPASGMSNSTFRIGMIAVKLKTLNRAPRKVNST